jgi:hypothetical protein
MSVDPVVARKALEDKADVESLDVLQHERRELVKKWAPLAAMFRGGNSASIDSIRKQHRALIMTQIEATDFKGSDKRPAENMLERLANASDKHIAFCDDLREKYVAYITLDNDITQINERIQSREVELRAYTAELRLQ